MEDPPAPATPDGITPDWLEQVLGRRPTAVTVEDLGLGVGLLGTVVRAQCTWDDGTVSSVVVKLPSAHAGNRTIVRRFGYDVREVGFYRELRAGRELPAPRCLSVGRSEVGPVLVLEDLAPMRRPDQTVGATEEEADAVADLAAAVHAAFWDDPSLPERPWLPGPPDEVVSGYGTWFSLCWEAAAAAVDADETDRLAALGAMRSFDAVVDRFAGAPRTLVHGDLRLDNVLFGPPPAVRAMAVDWQLAAWGRGAYDLAFFAAGSLTPATRRRVERPMVARWHRGLLARGVTGYDLAAAWLDYRLGLVLNLPNPVTALVAVDPGDERGRALLEANLRRALASVRDHWLDPDEQLRAATGG